MPASDSPAIIVARFLKTNNYERTLDAFIEEAGLQPDAGTVSQGDLTIETVLEEKKIFDLSLKYEKHGNEGANEWTLPAPDEPTVISLPEATNILSVSVQKFRIGNEGAAPALLATTAGRRLSVVLPDASLPLLHSTSPQDSPILSWTVIHDGRLSIGGAMSGQVVVYDNVAKSVASERRDHAKYVVRVAAHEVPSTQATYIATASWDGKVHLYREHLLSDPTLSSPLATLALPTNPEDLLFLSSPTTEDAERIVLVVTRRDSTSLHFYLVPRGPGSSRSGATLTLLGSQNLSPHAQAWSAFSCSSMALCPTDPSLIAVATSSIPSLKLIVAELLVPSRAPQDHATSSSGPVHPSHPLSYIPSTAAVPYTSVTASATASASAPVTQVAQSRAALVQQEAFAAAVQLHVSTQAPQTPYSTPRVAWRPDGSGLWVNGDDGLVRGVERSSGKVVAVLKGGHEGAVKVRDIWAGWVDVEGDEEREGTGSEDAGRRRKEEWVVSGGFDRRVVVWRVGSERLDNSGISSDLRG